MGVAADFSTNTIYIRGEITRADIRKVADATTAMMRVPVWVDIDSDGGSAHASTMIADIFAIHGRVTTFISGEAASGAAFLTMGASARAISSDGKIMLHGVSGGTTEARLKFNTRHAVRLRRVTGHSFEGLARWTGENDVWFSPVSAKVLRLVDVVQPATDQRFDWKKQQSLLRNDIAIARGREMAARTNQFFRQRVDSGQMTKRQAVAAMRHGLGLDRATRR